MITWTKNGPIIHINKDEVNQVIQKALKECMKEYGYMTIRLFYEKIKKPLSSVEEYSDSVYAAETFINPDNYGWDEKGYRKLFETVIKRYRL